MNMLSAVMISNYNIFHISVAHLVRFVTLGGKTNVATKSTRLVLMGCWPQLWPRNLILSHLFDLKTHISGVCILFTYS